MYNENKNNLFLFFFKIFLYVNNFENKNCEKDFDLYKLKCIFEINIEIKKTILILFSIFESKLLN